LTSRTSRSGPKNRRTTPQFNHSLDNPPVMVTCMVTFHMFACIEPRSTIPTCPVPVGARSENASPHPSSPLPKQSPSSPLPPLAPLLPLSPSLHLTPLLPIGFALFSSTALTQPFSFQSLPHSFHRNGDVPPLSLPSSTVSSPICFIPHSHAAHKRKKCALSCPEPERRVRTNSLVCRTLAPREFEGCTKAWGRGVQRLTKTTSIEAKSNQSPTESAKSCAPSTSGCCTASGAPSSRRFPTAPETAAGTARAIAAPCEDTKAIRGMSHDPL
jgi:hypothetical protein